MVRGTGVPQRDSSERRARERRLQGHDASRVLGGCGLRLTRERQDGRHVIDVVPPKGVGGSASIRIVVAIWHTEPALCEPGYVVRGIVGGGFRTKVNTGTVAPNRS